MSSPGTAPAVWRKSARSAAQGNCVETAALAHDTVGLRDSKHPDRAHLTFSRRQFTRFAESVKRL